MKLNALAVTALLSAASALELDVTDEASIKAAAAKIAGNLAFIFPLNDVSLLGEPYYFWQTAHYLSSLADYLHLTNDTSIISREKLTADLSFQLGPNSDYMPINETRTMGNDDQSYWALAALTAAEHDLVDGDWLPILERVWNLQAQRWDTSSCYGGLRWQIFSFNAGYDYKNSASNMNFFLLSARMAAYTGNATYAKWAETVYEWSADFGLINERGDVFDGALVAGNCSELDKLQFSRDVASAAYGSAILSSLSPDSSVDIWGNRTATHVNALVHTFVSTNAILVETGCEAVQTCNLDQKAFKGITASYLWKIQQLSGPSVAPIEIQNVLETNAKAAAASCQDDGACGFGWLEITFDQDMGPAQQLNALNIIVGLLSSNATRDGNATETPTAPGAADGEANETVSAPPTISQTGAASSFGSVSAGWGVGVLALGFAALL